MVSLFFQHQILMLRKLLGILIIGQLFLQILFVLFENVFTVYFCVFVRIT